MTTQMLRTVRTHSDVNWEQEVSYNGQALRLLHFAYDSKLEVLSSKIN